MRFRKTHPEAGGVAGFCGRVKAGATGFQWDVLQIYRVPWEHSRPRVQTPMDGVYEERCQLAAECWRTGKHRANRASLQALGRGAGSEAGGPLWDQAKLYLRARGGTRAWWPGQDPGEPAGGGGVGGVGGWAVLGEVGLDGATAL